MKFQNNSVIIPLISENNCYGGKAKGLLDLIRVGLPVPTTYSISYMDLKSKNFLGESISSLVPFPLIIRSSANVEDSLHFSFAGLFDSYVCYNQVDISEALYSMKFFPRKNIQFVYPHFDIESIYMNIVLQPYLVCEFSGVFISEGDNYGYGECVHGQLNRILHNGEIDASFSIGRHGVQFEGIEIPEKYTHLIHTHFLLVQDYFSDRCYQYEWCISQGVFYFLQKRPFLS